jgi:hypothetical protein
MIQHMLARSSLRRTKRSTACNHVFQFLYLCTPFRSPMLTPYYRRHDDRRATSRRERNDRHRYDSEDDARDRRSD